MQNEETISGRPRKCLQSNKKCSTDCVFKLKGREKIQYCFLCIRCDTAISCSPIRAVDPHSFFADPDPAVFLIAVPDPALKTL